LSRMDCFKLFVDIIEGFTKFHLVTHENSKIMFLRALFIVLKIFQFP